MLCHAVTLSSWPLTFTHLGCRVYTLYKIFAKSNNPRLSYWRIDSHIHVHVIFIHITGRFSRMYWPNLAWKKGDHGGLTSLFQSLHILLHFQMWAAQSWVMLKMTPNFALFDPPPVKISGGGGWVRYRDQLMKLHLQPNLWNTFDGHPLCSCWEPCIDKQKKVNQRLLRPSNILCQAAKWWWICGVHYVKLQLLRCNIVTSTSYLLLASKLCCVLMSFMLFLTSKFCSFSARFSRSCGWILINILQLSWDGKQWWLGFRCDLDSDPGISFTDSCYCYYIAPPHFINIHQMSALYAASTVNMYCTVLAC